MSAGSSLTAVLFPMGAGSESGLNNNNDNYAAPLDSISAVATSPTVLAIVGLLLVLLVLSTFTARSPTSALFPPTPNASGVSVPMIVGLTVVGLLALLVLAQFAGINLSYWFSPQAYKPSSDGKKPKLAIDKQVFNIPGNHYTYDDAKALCKAYGADLATYDQLEQAYNVGADWCNYGWSDGQMALFPTQKLTFEKLQKIKGHENDCGRPGINGGFMANPELQFGVNCYGKKPAITYDESNLLASVSPFPQTEEDLAFQRKVDNYKSQINSILISPFSYGKWTPI